MPSLALSSFTTILGLVLLNSQAKVAHAAFQPTCNNSKSKTVKINGSSVQCQSVTTSQCALIDNNTNTNVWQVCQLQCSSQSGCISGGQLTMWTTDANAVKSASCEYASTTATSGGSTPWLTNYVTPGMYCAVSDDLFSNGVGCGSCYRVVYNGVGGTDPGVAGSAIIQVVNSGAGGTKHFDCFLTAHKKITSASTGIFPVAYTKVACTSSPLAAVILDGNNAYYTKVLFAGGTNGVKAATMMIGTTTISMSKVSGATWSANLSGATNKAVSFKLTFSDGTTGTISGCFNNVWPVATGKQCIM